MRRPWLAVALVFTLGACSSGPEHFSERSPGSEPSGPDDGASLAQADSVADLPTVALNVKGVEGQTRIFKQRGANDRAVVQVRMPDEKFDAAEAFIVRGEQVRGKVFEVKAKRGEYFEASIPRGVGFQVRLRLFRKGVFFARGVTPPIIVGDIFLTVGQSNSTNAGSGRTVSRSDGAFMLTPDGSWQPAADPLLTAGDGSRGSSPWPSFADAYYWNLGVPVAVVSLGWGGSSAAEWLPTHKTSNLYARLKAYAKGFGPRGFRAVLWHQGETDVFFGTPERQYRQMLRTIIAQLRADTGWGMLPFVIANTSWIGEKGWSDMCNGLGGYPACTATIDRVQRAVLAGQTSTVEGSRYVYLGPNTDELWQHTYRSASESYIHFNEYGSYVHGTRWYEALARRLPPVK